MSGAHTTNKSCNCWCPPVTASQSVAPMSVTIATRLSRKKNVFSRSVPLSHEAPGRKHEWDAYRSSQHMQMLTLQGTGLHMLCVGYRLINTAACAGNCVVRTDWAPTAVHLPACLTSLKFKEISRLCCAKVLRVSTSNVLVSIDMATLERLSPRSFASVG